MDLIVNEMLLDCLNVAKVVFKKGLTGTLILGEKYQRVFTALPEYFTVSDHDIRITTSSDVMKDLEYIKSIIPDFIKNGAMARVIRDGVVIASDEIIASLQREKDTVKEVKKGFECGITLEKFNDFKEGDTIEAYEMIEVKYA